jgi:hypothetical protein
VPLSRVNPELPAEFELILAKALEKDPELGCQSAAELRADLKRLKRRNRTERTFPISTWLTDRNKPLGSCESAIGNFVRSLLTSVWGQGMVCLDH